MGILKNRVITASNYENEFLKRLQNQALTFCLLHCGSGGLLSLVIRTTFSGTRTGKLSQSTTTTNNFPLQGI